MRTAASLLICVCAFLAVNVAIAHNRSIVEIHTVRRSVSREIVDGKPVLKPRLRSGRGTGFYIRTRLVATARHVIRGAHKITVHCNGKMFAGEVVHQDPDHDIAFVKVRRWGIPYVLCADVKSGDMLEVILMTHGRITSKMGRLEGDFLFRYWSEIEVIPGDSGSPALHGRCIAGLVIAYHSTFAPSIFEGFDDIRKALIEYEKE